MMPSLFAKTPLFGGIAEKDLHVIDDVLECPMPEAERANQCPMTLRIETITDLQSLERLTPEWQQLADQLDPQTPFVTPTWNLLWWKHFRERRRLVRDELRVQVVRDNTGALVAIAPMMLTSRPCTGPLRMRTLQFFGTDPNITEIRGMVCRPDDEPAVVTALNAHFLRHGRDWDWVQWFGLRHKPEPPPPMRETPVLLDYTLNLPPTWEEFRAPLSRNIKEALRKCYNSLQRDQHAFTFKVVQRPVEVESALATFFELHRMRAITSGTIHHQDVFASDRARAFLTDYSRAMAERGELFIFQLIIAGEIVATRIGFGVMRALFMYYSGYNPNWGRYSVMTTVLAEAIKWAIGNTYAVVNLSTGTDVSKTRWSPIEHRYHAAILQSSHLRGRTTQRFVGLLQSRLRGSEALAGVWRRVRRGH